MKTSVEAIDYFRKDFDLFKEELEIMSKREYLQIEINEGLEEALLEMKKMQGQISANEYANLIELCKNTVIETITGQFGLASLFIESKDGGNVTTSHNFENGIVSTDLDRKKYETFIENNDGTKKWGDVRKEIGYDNPLSNKRKDAFKSNDVIIDSYTGKPLSKDGQAHLDHIVSAKEIESSAANNLFMTPEERAKMATNDKNLTFTEGRANQSKGDLKMEEWLTKEDSKTGQTKADKYGIDKEKALEKDREARKFVKKEITVAAAKKYGSELLKTGGKDAAMMAAYSSLGLVLRDFTQAIFVEVHITLRDHGKESLSEIFCRFKERLEKTLVEIKGKWKDILKSGLESGLTAFFSNLLVFIINLVATTLKKIVTMIRAGFVSLVQAMKIMVNPPEGMPKEDIAYHALKILTSGLIGAASIGLSAGIEKLLQSIPGLQPLMMFAIPFPGKQTRTVSDILAVTMSALVGGLLTTIVLYFMDKCRDNSKNEKLHINLVSQSGVVVQYKIAQTWMTLDDAYRCLHNIATDFAYYISDGQTILQESSERANQAISNLSDANKRLKNLLYKH